MWSAAQASGANVTLSEDDLDDNARNIVSKLTQSVNVVRAGPMRALVACSRRPPVVRAQGVGEYPLASRKSGKKTRSRLREFFSKLVTQLGDVLFDNKILPHTIEWLTHVSGCVSASAMALSAFPPRRPCWLVPLPLAER
jgi:hypothetical protein